MSWKLSEKSRHVLAAEQAITPLKRGGSLSLCLVYPNLYRTAMSNLGFQTVYAQCNDHSGVVCERAFLPDADEMREYGKGKTTLISLETQRPLGEFDVIAFSVSFESDYLNIPTMFDLARIPPLASSRTSSHPLVVAGGAALFLNPEPVAEFMDVIGVGEAEVLLSPLLQLLLDQEGEERSALLQKAALLPGIYVPAGYRVEYDGARVVSRTHGAGFPERVVRAWLPDLDRHVTASRFLTDATEFGDMYLVEVSRGCPRGCRFCAAGFIYHPYRHRSLQSLKDAIDEGVALRPRIGLVGAALSDYPGIGPLCAHIIGQGGKVSVSSLRIDALDEQMIELLKESGHKTVALAPEGGSQRMRDLIRKGITEEQILTACDRLIGHDILNMKLYFIIGLPRETMEDLVEMVRLIGTIRERVIVAARRNKRLGEVIISVNPFVPKPWTPFQWCGMEGLASLQDKERYLRKEIGRLSNVRLLMANCKDAVIQTLLSRGDRRLTAMLLAAASSGSWRKGAREAGIDVEELVRRTIPLDEMLPWEVIDGGDVERLRKEFCRAFGFET
jgi:radical SAM superfamily enzyme YgiQ (UPF0313 family)